MSKRTRIVVGAALAAGIMLALSGGARAQARGHGGDTADRTYPPSHYKPPPAYRPPRHCDWVSERYRWHGGWHWRRVWRCR